MSRFKPQIPKYVYKDLFDELICHSEHEDLNGELICHSVLYLIFSLLGSVIAELKVNCKSQQQELQLHF